MQTWFSGFASSREHKKEFTVVGDAFFSFVNGIVEMLGRICLPIILLGYTNIGVWVIWLTAGLTWMLAGVSCVLRYRSWVVKKSGLRSKI